MTTRREFLTGQMAGQEPVGEAGEVDAPVLQVVPPATNTICLSTTAMAADFEVFLNPGPGSRLAGASEALELIQQMEDQVSVYRPQSEVSRLNAAWQTNPPPVVEVEAGLFRLVSQALELAEGTSGAFDPTAGRLVRLWRGCRQERRPPSPDELADALAKIGYGNVQVNRERLTLSTTTAGLELNFNAFGKGYALDRAGEVLERWLAGSESRPPAAPANGPPAERPACSSWLMHGGFSSLLARGSLAGADGWPIAIRDPQFPGRSLATIWLKDRGLSTSGAGVQGFRHGGRRYGHLIDPRTGWPCEGMLAVTVLAPTAAEAEALSTAFFVLGVETARAYCHNHPLIAALLCPVPPPGERCEVVNCGLSELELMFASNH